MIDHLEVLAELILSKVVKISINISRFLDKDRKILRKNK
jgi:hypothetical protein